MEKRKINMNNAVQNLVPFVKWVGGKRQLLPELIQRVPSEYGTYFEPFLGGGAMLFELKPEKAVVNDLNPQLINCYLQIREKPLQFLEALKILQNEYNKSNNPDEQTKFYLSVREDFNTAIQNHTSTPKTAAMTVFLNKAGFNGLYRVSQKGKYNVPSAHKKKINCCNRDNILGISELLQNVELLNCDFEACCKDAKKGDFVFFDSPYHNTFSSYQDSGFTEEDHIRLSKLVKKISKKGVKFILTNSNSNLIMKLYKDFRIDEIDVKRYINCDASNRVGKEIIVQNF